MKEKGLSGRIDTITAEGMLPRVFAREGIPPSDVWQCKLTLKRGTDYLIEARSGGGKSSFCAYVMGLRADFEGHLYFNGKDTAVFGIGEWQEIRRRHIAYVPQDLVLFPELTALENIRLKNELTGWKEDGEIEEWLHMLGIDSRRDTPVGKMSVGQQQRVGIIRALCQPFDFMLLDEPVSHLDGVNNAVAAKLISDEARKQGASVVTTSVGNRLAIEGGLILKL